MSNPLSNVPPPAALPSFVAAPLPPPAAVAVPPPAGAAVVTTSVPPTTGSPAPPSGVSATPPPPPMGLARPLAARPPLSVSGAAVRPLPGPQPRPMAPPMAPFNIPPPMVSVNEAAPPIHSLQPAVSVPPPASAPPAAGGPPPPPPVGTGHVPLSYAGHLSRPRYVAPPELATTGGAAPAPLYQTGAVTGAPAIADTQPGVSVMSMPAVGGATVDYAQTPYASSPGPAAVGGYGGSGGGGGQGGEQGEGWLGWLKGTVQKSEVLSKVAERARTSMDSMITTLDPQMRDIIYSGGDLDIVVASDKELKVSAIREAFQTVFGKATVIGVPTPGPGLVPQPLGWQGARAAAEARVQSLRSSGLVPAQQAIVAAEGFIVQLHPERWFDMTLLLLDEPGTGALSVFTQPTELPEAWVQKMEGHTAPDHPQRWAGLQLTTGQVATEMLQVAPSAWHEVLCGLTRRELLVPAARALAHQFRTRRGS